MPSIALPRSSASLSSGDEVPHIFTRKSRLKPGKFSIVSAKGLLQQYLPIPDLSRCSKRRADERLLDDLVGGGEQRVRHRKAERLGGLRLITSSYLVGACTGRSAGFSPLRMRST